MTVSLGLIDLVSLKSHSSYQPEKGFRQHLDGIQPSNLPSSLYPFSYPMQYSWLWLGGHPCV